jgi:flagellar basal body rod protein FlgG
VTANGEAYSIRLSLFHKRAIGDHRADGTVSYTLAGQTAAQQAGQIQLANFANPSGLNSLGDSLSSRPMRRALR